MESHASYNERIFTRLSNAYDLVVFWVRPFRRAVARECNLHTESVVLDIACGTGEQTKEFAKTGAMVFGIDLSKGMLVKARKKLSCFPNVTLQECDATSLPFEDNYFDVTSVSLGLHDMPAEIIPKVIAEMKRVTKQGGIIAIAEHNNPSNPIGKFVHRLYGAFDTKYFKPFMQKGLESYLSDANIEIERTMLGPLGAIKLFIATNR